MTSTATLPSPPASAAATAATASSSPKPSLSSSQKPKSVSICAGSDGVDHHLLAGLRAGSGGAPEARRRSVHFDACPTTMVVPGGASPGAGASVIPTLNHPGNAESALGEEDEDEETAAAGGQDAASGQERLDVGSTAHKYSRRKSAPPNVICGGPESGPVTKECSVSSRITGLRGHLPFFSLTFIFSSCGFATLVLEVAKD